MRIQHIKAVECSSHRTHEEMYSFKSWGWRWGVLHSSPRSIQNPPSPREPWFARRTFGTWRFALRRTRCTWTRSWGSARGGLSSCSPLNPGASRRCLEMSGRRLDVSIWGGVRAGKRHQLLVSTDSLSHGDGRDQGGRRVRKEKRNGEGAGGENSQESSCFSSRLWTRLPRAAGGPVPEPCEDVRGLLPNFPPCLWLSWTCCQLPRGLCLSFSKTWLLSLVFCFFVLMEAFRSFFSLLLLLFQWHLRRERR